MDEHIISKNDGITLIYRPPYPKNMTPEQLKKYEIAKKMCKERTIR